MSLRVNRGPFVRGLMSLCMLCMLFVLVACGSEDNEAGAKDGKIKITATIGMISDIVREIGGEHVEVTGLMGPGVDPHLYKASQGDIRKLDQADIVFYNGLHLEGKMTEILEKMGDEKTVVAVAGDIDKAKLRSGQDTGGTEFDPHIWFDVQLWMEASQKVIDTLKESDPAHADDYTSKGEAYLAQLKALDQEVRKSISQIPEATRVLVTAHDAFGYYGQAYNIKVMGLQGISTAAEYGSKDVSVLRDYLIDNKIKAVFVESSIPAKSMEAIIAGALEKGHQIQIGGELYSDAMGEEGSEADNYIGMIRRNTEIITKALK